MSCFIFLFAEGLPARQSGAAMFWGKFSFIKMLFYFASVAAGCVFLRRKEFQAANLIRMKYFFVGVPFRRVDRSVGAGGLVVTRR